jgi:hypothetical protein
MVVTDDQIAAETAAAKDGDVMILQPQMNIY